MTALRVRNNLSREQWAPNQNAINSNVFKKMLQMMLHSPTAELGQLD